MSGFTTEVSSHDITLSWGGRTFGVTAMQWSGSAVSEIDITSMDSLVIEDLNYSGHKLVKKSVDYAVVDLGELTCDYFGPGGFTTDDLGTQSTLSVGGLGLSKPAFLTKIGWQASVGEYVKGNCTFRLSDA